MTSLKIILLQSWGYHLSLLNFSSTLIPLRPLSPLMSAFCLLSTVNRWFLPPPVLLNDRSIVDLSHAVFFFDTQLATKKVHEGTMAMLHIAQLPPSWAGHGAGAWNAASFPGTKMKYGDGVDLAEVRRAASRELRVKVGSRPKTIQRKQSIPQRLGRLGPPHDFAGTRGPGCIHATEWGGLLSHQVLWWLGRGLSLSSVGPLLEELYF